MPELEKESVGRLVFGLEQLFVGWLSLVWTQLFVRKLDFGLE